MFSPILTFVLALILSVLAVGLLLPQASRLRLLDEPDSRKQHRQATPLVGGLAIGICLLLLLPLFNPQQADWLPMLTASLILLSVGLIDDIRELEPNVRFLAQILAALVMSTWGDAELRNLGDLLGNGEVLLGIWALPFTVFCALGVMNATNMQDGLDGLAGGLMLVFVAMLALLAWQHAAQDELTVLFILAGALVGFLAFNFPWRVGGHARTFLGDAGSLLLGGLASWFLIRFSQQPQAIVKPMTAVWLLAVPLLDAVTIMFRRIARGRSPFRPDREHLHHFLLALGMNGRQVVMLELVLSLLLALVGVVAQRQAVPESIMFWSFWTLFAVFFAVMELGWSKLNQRSVA